MATAKGTFEVKLSKLAFEGVPEGGALERRALDKQFHGDLEATSKGQMLSAGSAATGSGGYVAIELVTGTLAGRKGSFALQHFGTMDGGAYDLSIQVVPGSATDEFAGLHGKMSILIENGKHSYTLEHNLAAR